MNAVRKNNVDTVTLLLQRGADISVKDAADKTSLYVAAEEDCWDVIDVCLLFNFTEMYAMRCENCAPWGVSKCAIRYFFNSLSAIVQLSIHLGFEPCSTWTIQLEIDQLS